MTEQEFLKELSGNLQGVPKEERERSLNFYREIFADKKEEGLSEEDAVASVGKPEEVAKEIVWAYYQGDGSDKQQPKKQEKTEKEKGKIGAKRIVGRAFALLGWTLLFLIVFSVWLTLPVAAVGGLISGLVEFFTSGVALGLFTVGVSLIAVAGTVWTWWLVKKFCRFIGRTAKNLFSARA